MNYEIRCLDLFSEPALDDDFLLRCVVYTYDGIFRSDAFCEGGRYRDSAFIRRWRRFLGRLGRLL